MRNATIAELLAERFNLLPAVVYDTFPAVLFGRVLAIAVRLGVFEALHATPRSSDMLADNLSLSRRGSELMLRSLEAGGYLKSGGEQYRLTPRARKWLVRTSPSYLGHFIEYVELLHSHWLTLEETIREGKPRRTYFELFGEKEWKTYTLGMMDLARLILPRLVKKIKISKSARRLLDLGGSHGLYSIEMCRRHPDLTAEIVDTPQVLSTTAGIIREHGFEKRVLLVPGDLATLKFEHEKYDVVFAFNILHGFDEETNRRLLKAVANALAPRGAVYILDQFTDGRTRGVERFLPLMVGLNLLNEIGGDAYSFEHIQTMCSEVGLGDIKQHTIGLPGVRLLSVRRSRA